MNSHTRRHRRRLTADQTALVGRLHAGDPEAFDRLYRQHVAAVTRYVAARLRARDRDAVDDCVHDAFCDALADPTLIGVDMVGSLLRLAARAVTRHGWSQRRYIRAAYTVYADYGGADAQAATRTAPLATHRSRISHALARLSDEQRRTVHLRYLDGHSRVMVAALMGRTVEVVRNLERQAVAHLKADLADADLGHGPLGRALTASAGPA